MRNASYQCLRMEEDSRLETDLGPHRSAGTEGIVKLHSTPMNMVIIMDWVMGVTQSWLPTGPVTTT